jgi:hypothetical protein
MLVAVFAGIVALTAIGRFTLTSTKAGSRHECFDVDQLHSGFTRDNLDLLMLAAVLTLERLYFDLYQVSGTRSA